MENYLKNKNAQNSLVLLQDLVYGLAVNAPIIQNELDQYQFKETVRLKRIIEESDLSLDEFYVENLLPDFMHLESFTVDANLDLRTIKEKGATITASMFGRVTSAFFEVRYTDNQKVYQKINVEVKSSINKLVKQKEIKEN